jgi:transposase
MYRLHWCREHKTLQEEVAYANHLDRQMSSPQALSFARRESMKAYSQDLRKRVLRAVDLGRERRRGCAAVCVSLATIKRYLKQRREEGHMRPKAIPGRPPKKRAQVEADVLPQLQAHDDATLEQHSAMWEQTHGERVRSFPMSRAMKRLGWTRKKSRSGRQSATRRSGPAGRENASKLPTEALVFLDECGSNIALTRMTARAPKGERARGSVPRESLARIRHSLLRFPLKAWERP